MSKQKEDTNKIPVMASYDPYTICGYFDFENTDYPWLYSLEWYQYQGSHWALKDPVDLDITHRKWANHPNNAHRFSNVTNRSVSEFIGAYRSYVNTVARPNQFLPEKMDDPAHWNKMHFIPCKTSLYCVDKRKKIPSTTKYFNSYALPYDVPDKPSPTPVFDQCLEDYWPGNPEQHRLIWQILGYILSPCPNNTIIYLYGPSGAGKGTIIDVIKMLLHLSNITSMRFSDFYNNKFWGEDAIGKQVMLFADARTNEYSMPLAAIENLLCITGGDPVGCLRKGKKAITTPLPCKVVIASNELVKIPETQGGFARRILFVNFENEIKKENQNIKGVDGLLSKEMPGILYKAITGLQDYLTNGFLRLPNNEDIMECFKDKSDPIRAWSDNNLELRQRSDEEGGPFNTLKTVLWENFKIWANDNRDKNAQQMEKTAFEIAFANHLKKLGLHHGYKRAQKQAVWQWVNITRNYAQISH